MKWKAVLPILVLTWLMVGCQTLATPEQSIPPTVQAAKSVPPPMTATSRPTATVTPPEVPEIAIPTLDIAATVIAISPPRIHSSFLSADGQWRAEVVIHDCVKLQGNIDANAVEILKLIRVNNETEMIIENTLLNCGGVGAGGLGGLLWSPNNRYFYYTDAREGLPDGGCGYWARPIKRVNVDSQKVEAVGGGHISPDETKLAFWQDNEIVIWSLDEGEIARVPATVPEAFESQIAWSLDSQSLVYLQTELDCFPTGYSYVTRLDLSGMIQTLLLESKEPSFSWLAWDAPYRISLVDDKGNRWRYNLVSKELEPMP
jgi:hypothetical protein